MAPYYLLCAILIGGIVAGTLDIGAAAAVNRLAPLAILRFVASGLLGAKALKGGLATSAWGFVLQLAMSIVIAAIYGFASLWLPLLADMWIAGGLIYGVGVYIVMTHVVLPLSAAPRTSLARHGENGQGSRGDARFRPDRRLRRPSRFVLG